MDSDKTEKAKMAQEKSAATERPRESSAAADAAAKTAQKKSAAAGERRASTNEDMRPRPREEIDEDASEPIESAAGSGAAKLELDRGAKAEILEKVTPILASVAVAGLVGAAVAIISQLTATNYKSSSLIGDKEIHPTEDNVSISKSDTAAAETEGKLAQDKVSAVNGDLAASEVEAAAQSGEATAVESGATAARTKAGAADIETKALKMT
jgi:hypothetical protein